VLSLGFVPFEKKQNLLFQIGDFAFLKKVCYVAFGYVHFAHASELYFHLPKFLNYLLLFFSVAEEDFFQSLKLLLSYYFKFFLQFVLVLFVEFFF